MYKKYSKDQQRLYQQSDVLDLENSLQSDSFSASPQKDNFIIQQNEEKQFVYDRQQEEGIVDGNHEIKQEENDAGQNLSGFKNSVQYEHRDYHEEQHGPQREKVQRELLQEKQLNRKQQLIIEQKDLMISVLQEERRLFENEHKLRNDGLQEKKKELAAEKQKLENQSAKILRERQEKRQELQWQKSNRNTLNIIITEYGQAISSALERYSQAFDRDEVDRILSQLQQQSPSIDKNILQVDEVNHYLAQSLQSFTNIVIKKHQEKEKYYSFRLRQMDKEHKSALAEQAKTHLAKLNQLSSQLLQKQKDLKQKVAEIERLEDKLDKSQLHYSTNVESSRQQTQQQKDKIDCLTKALEREKANIRRKLEQLNSQTENKYLQLVQRAQDDLKLLQQCFSASQTSLEQKIKELKTQKLDTENIMNELTSSLTSKDEMIKVLQENLQSLKLESQKLQDFKRQNQELKSEYRELQAKLQQDFAKQIMKMAQQHKAIKDTNANSLNDLKFNLQKQHKDQQQLLKCQIDNLKKEIDQWKNKGQNYLDDFRNLKASFQAKKKAHQTYKIEFQVKAAEVIESIVKDKSTQSQNNSQIFLQTAKDLQDKLAQQCQNKQLLCRNYCKLDEKYNDLSKQHFIQSLELQETSLSLLQVQFKEQICIKEITQLRDILSEIKEMHKNVVEEIQSNFDEKLSTTIEETSQFYQVILDSKEKIYETDLQKLHQQLQSLRLIKNIKEKISADNQINLGSQRQDLKMKIKAMQREHDCVIKAKKNEITTLTESNQFLKKSLDLSEETSQAKQRILQSLQHQRALFRKTINFIHNQLDEKSLQQVLEELDRSNDAYNQEVIDMVNGIFFSVSGVRVQNKRLQQENLQIALQKEKLGYILREIKVNAEDKDKKLEKIEKIATQTSKFQEKINSLEAELKSARSKSQEHIKSLNLAQEKAKKSEQELESIRSSEKQVKKDNERIKAKLEQATKAKNDIQRMLSEKETQLNIQIRDLNKKIDTLTKERSLSNKEIENSMQKENEQLKLRLQTQNSRLTKFQLQIRELKNGNERLIAEKSALERTVANLQKEKSQLEETINRLRTREQEPVRRQVNSPSSRDSQKLIQYEQKASQLEMKNKKLERDLSEAKNELVQSKKNVKKLLDEINQLKRDLDDEPKSQERKNSWNEQEELVRGYQQMANNAREQNLLLQQQIESLREKLKKSEANNQRSIRSYVSPPKENGLSDNKSPPKKSQIKQEGSEKNEELKKNILFSTNCIMESDHQGSAFIASKIEEIFGNKKKIESTQMLFKYSQSVKTYPFSYFLPKELLQTQCFFIIFAAKSAKFAILSYKLQANSRQSALLFSISNKKAINKRGNDNGVYQAVTVESGGDFVVGGGHIRMKPSSKMLAVKDVYRYFEPYDKKEMYGSEYWREDPIVELTEFEIHRVFLK